jgi:hypothetical protein
VNRQGRKERRKAREDDLKILNLARFAHDALRDLRGSLADAAGNDLGVS